MKEHFLLSPDLVFLNHGSFGACPRTVMEEFHRIQLDMERNPVEFLGRRSADLLLASRTRLADHLGTGADCLVYVVNATTGVNTVARSLSLRAGDQVLTCDHEYGACDNAWEFICTETGAEYVKAGIRLPFDPEQFVDDFWRSVGPRTRLIFLSHITSSSALVLPVEEICRRAREAGITTLIDGAHVPGHIPLDLDALGADFYTGNCHKWLLAPKSAAFLYARPEHQPALHALVVSWGYGDSVEGHTGFEAYLGSTLFERRQQWQGTRDIAAFLAVPAAIDFQDAHDWDRVRRDSHLLALLAQERICALTGMAPIAPDDSFAQMVAIPVPGCDPQWLKDILFDRYRIELPITDAGGSLFARISINGYNTGSDVDALVAAMEELLPFRGSSPG